MQGNQKQAQYPYAYIAGLLEGEGSFMITRSKNGSRGKLRNSPSYCPRVRCHMGDREGLDFIVKSCGYGKVRYAGIRPSRPNRIGMYQWEIHSFEPCKKFIELIYDYMVIERRRKAAMHLYDFCCLCIKTKQENKRYGIPEYELAWRHEMYLQMRKMNAKGAAATTNPQELERVK